MADLLRQIVERNRAGEAVAIPSVCSAHPDVLRASMARAAVLGRPLVVEATSNQVNQDGGYTGQTPDAFIAMALELAKTAGLDRDSLVFGGDHLGPQAWRAQDAETAMAKAHVMVADYVAAGFSKIHLDCSEGCRGENPTLADAITARRSAALARTCLQASPDPDRLLFVVGTEVPPPGGARVDEGGDIPATKGDDAVRTLAAHKAAFEAAGIGAAFAQVAGLVVQPGVEFSPMAVHAYPMDRKLPFRTAMADWPGVCLEAHSTDYQKPAVYPHLAAEGFAFQKVGPALTFAWRQAVYALDVLRSLLGHPGPTLKDSMEALMTTSPDHWHGHYSGTAEALHIARHFGLADRIRYYWPQEDAHRALQQLKAWLGDRTLPEPMLRQVFSSAVLDRAEALPGTLADRLIDAEVQIALGPYFFDPVPGAGSTP